MSSYISSGERLVFDDASPAGSTVSRGPGGPGGGREREYRGILVDFSDNSDEQRPEANQDVDYDAGNEDSPSENNLSPFSKNQGPNTTGNTKGSKSPSVDRDHNRHDQTGEQRVGTKGEQEYIRLYYEGMDRQLAKRQWVCMERLRKEQEEAMEMGCTFRPQLSPYAQSKPRPRAASPEFRVKAEVQMKKHMLDTKRSQAVVEELSKCTFRPLTLSAAKLGAEADIRRETLHADLHALHAEKLKFREDVVPEAVQKIDDYMVHPKTRPHVLSKEEVEDVVMRLLRAEEPEEKASYPGEENTFHPKISAKSELLLVQKKMRESLPPPVPVSTPSAAKPEAARGRQPHRDESDFTPNTKKTLSRSRSIADDARRQHLCNLFVRLATQWKASSQKQHHQDVSGPSASTEKSDADSAEKMLALCIPIQGLANAAFAILQIDDAEDLTDVLGRSGANRKTMNVEEFVSIMMRDASYFGSKAFMFPKRERVLKATRQYLKLENTRKPQICKGTREIMANDKRSFPARFSKSSSVAHDLEQKRKQREEEQKQKEEQFSFRPVINETYVPPQHAIEARERFQASRAANFNQDDHAPLLAEPSHASKDTVQQSGVSPGKGSSHFANAAVRGVGEHGSIAATSGIVRYRSTMPYRGGGGARFTGTISERAAFGADGALTDYGRRLMEQQLIDAEQQVQYLQ